MSNEQCHIIKRQILEVEVDSSGINGQAVQKRLSEVYRDRVIPVMEQTLNRFADRDQWISIDRLEIDLGELSLDGLDGNFSQKVEEQLFRVIREKIYTHHLQKELAAQGISTRTEDDGKVTVKTSAAAKADLLAGFLKTGRIPWNAGMQMSSKPVSDLLEELLEEAPAVAADVLKRELRHSLQRTRFILQMPDDLIRKAVAVCVDTGTAGSGKRTLAGFAASVIEVLNSHELPVLWNMSTLRTRIWSLVIDQMLLQSGGSDPAGMEEKIHDLLDRLIFGRGDGGPAILQPQRFLMLLADELPLTAAARESGFASRLPAVIRRYADSNRQQDTGPGKDADVPAKTKRGKEMAEREIDDRTNIEPPDGGEGETAHTAVDEKRKSDRDKESDSPDSGSEISAADVDEKEIPGSAGMERTEEDHGSDSRSKHDGTDTSEVEDLSRSGEQAGAEDAMQEKGSADEDSRQKPESEGGRPGAGDNEKQKQNERVRPQAGDEAFEADTPPAKIHRSYNIGEKADEAWVQNAGLVLLHPFLVRFFDQVGLVKEKQFVSQDVRLRAVHLLQYVGTGEQETPEQELFLNKLLCGLEPEYPVPSGIELTRQEKEECVNVLKSVVGHWKALKKSSPEAVRTAFLRREGLVSREGMHGGWKVTIERNSFDVLLNRLPWGLSMIKMPWNSYLIHVEW